MAHNGNWYPSVAPDNKYLYNGKEFNDDFGIDLYDYGARWYDPAMGRWTQVDQLAEVAPAWSTYRYGFDNPITNVDPTGMFERRTTAVDRAKQESLSYIDTGPEEKEQNQQASIDATIVNDTNLSTSQLASITYHTAGIYERQGFGAELFNFKILTGEQGRKVFTEKDLFIAIVNSSVGSTYGRPNPGNTEVLHNGKTDAWGGDGFCIICQSQ